MNTPKIYEKIGCEGCYMKKKCSVGSRTLDEKNSRWIKCPCQICIVKFTCNESGACDIYEFYRDFEVKHLEEEEMNEKC